MYQKVRPKELGYLFVIGGPGGSGSSTIAKMLSEHFNLKRIYGGSLFRKLLEERGYVDNDRAYFQENEKLLMDLDKEVDGILFKECDKPNVLIESKNFAALAKKHDIPCTVKIWIEASLHVRTIRAMSKYGFGFNFRNIITYLRMRFDLVKRYRMDYRRYYDIQGINYSNPSEYNDIVIDSSYLNEKETFDLILKYIKDGGYIK
jgi:cytidylate kinase